MTEPINDQNLIELLRMALPELEKGYAVRVARARGKYLPSNYEVVGFVLKPLIRKELDAGVVNDFVRRVAAFIERVCVSGNVEAINVFWVKIFEWLINDRECLKLIWPSLGPETKAKVEDAAQRWGKVANLPFSGRLGAIGSAFRRH